MRIMLTRAKPFSHVFLFGNMFTESYGFVDMPVTSSYNFVSFHQLDRDKLQHVSVIQQRNRDSQETSYQKENTRKMMVEFLRKS